MTNEALTACCFILGARFFACWVSRFWAARRRRRTFDRRRDALAAAGRGRMPRRPLPVFSPDGFRLPAYVRQRS